MPNNKSSHVWISRFCARLIKLSPATSLPVAVHRAVAVYPHSGELEPEYAASLAAAGNRMRSAVVRYTEPATARNVRSNASTGSGTRRSEFSGSANPHPR